MDKRVKLLDCTLRDGAYIVDSMFGRTAIEGISRKLQDANVDIIECGWLKDKEHEEGSSFFHVPNDLLSYLPQKDNRTTFVAMIDWNRYNLDTLPVCDHQTIDAIRVVFPKDHFKEGVGVGRQIEKKGYQVYYQAANTLAYTDEELKELAQEVNATKAICISVVDTFGAMFTDDLKRIVSVLHANLKDEVQIGFHSHNNQQLSFALTMDFVKMMNDLGRKCVVDASLCGMGRGAGNATTELVANYLNQKHGGNYDMNVIMDTIDLYMTYFQEKFTWGYSTPYFIAGMYCCHVNNIAYLTKNHRTSAKDIRNIISSLSEEERRQYDYDLLESKYIENQNRIVEDDKARKELSEVFRGRKILLVAPGKSIETEKDKIQDYMDREKPIVIAVNALHAEYTYDYLFVTNSIRYEYAKKTHGNTFAQTKKILLSNIKTEGAEDEYIISFNRVIQRGWEHFDNAVILALRLMDKLKVEEIAIAGFDGFKTRYNESYADAMLPTLNPDNKWDELNEEIKDMYQEFRNKTKDTMSVAFVTESIFE